MNQDARGAYIVCRTPGQPGDDWYHIYPRGEFEVVATIKGKEEAVVLVLDDDTFAAIMAARDEAAAQPNWEGYLVGQEHFAHMATGASEAHAWCMDLDVREDGLWGRFVKTPLGAASIGSVYKYRSPVSDLERISGRRWRPINIVDIGLTNKPKFKTLAAAQGREGRNPKEDAMLERMRAILGLQTDATDDQVVARVQTALDAEKTVETTRQSLVVLQGEVLAREADAFVEEHQDRIADTDEARAQVKARYIADADGTKATFSSLRVAPAADADPGDGAQRVLSRDGVKTPDGSVIAQADDKSRLRAREQEVFVAQVQKEIGCRTRAEARAVAEERKPELFA